MGILSYRIDFDKMIGLLAGYLNNIGDLKIMNSDCKLISENCFVA